MSLSTPPKIPDYELLRPIGQGGYGDVWLAKTLTGIFRAVKIVRRSSFEHSERTYNREFNGIRRFEPISRSHEGFVNIFHVGLNDAEGFFYYVMELADDIETAPVVNPDAYQPRTLRSELRRHGRLAVARCVQIGLALSAALHELHTRGLVHRDIKPSNIIFIDGKPKLADIGLVTGDGDERSLVGTEGYLPPEPGQIGTVRADLYALGKVLYEMSVGKDRLQFPEVASGLPGFADREAFTNLNEVFLAACDTDPRGRFATAQTMHQALTTVAQGKRPCSPRPTRTKLILGAAVFATLAAAAAWYATHNRLQRIHTFTWPDPAAWTNPRVLDFDGGGSTEIALVNRENLVVLSEKGEILRTSNTLEEGSALSWVRDADTNRQSRLVISWTQGSQIAMQMLNQHLQTIHTFELLGALRTNIGTQKIEPASYLAGLAYDPSSDQLYGNIITAKEKMPRGVASFNATTGNLNWIYQTAPIVAAAIVRKLDETEQNGLVVGSVAVSNTNLLANGTTDLTSYAYGLSAAGKELWKFEVGGYPTRCEPFELAPPIDEFFLAATRSPDFAPESGKIWRLDRTGRPSIRSDGTVRKYNAHHQLMSWLATSDRIAGKPEALLSDRLGRLHVLDADLNLETLVQIVPHRFDSTELYIDAVLDLDGDGNAEIVLHSLQKENISGNNPGNLEAENNVRLYHNKTVWILDSSLKTIGKYLIDKKSQTPELRVFPLRRNDPQGSSLLVLTGLQPIVLEWKPWTWPRSRGADFQSAVPQVSDLLRVHSVPQLHSVQSALCVPSRPLRFKAIRNPKSAFRNR